MDELTKRQIKLLNNVFLLLCALTLLYVGTIKGKATCSCQPVNNLKERITNI